MFDADRFHAQMIERGWTKPSSFTMLRGAKQSMPPRSCGCIPNGAANRCNEAIACQNQVPHLVALHQPTLWFCPRFFSWRCLFQTRWYGLHSRICYPSSANRNRQESRTDGCESKTWTKDGVTQKTASGRFRSRRHVTVKGLPVILRSGRLRIARLKSDKNRIS